MRYVSLLCFALTACGSPARSSTTPADDVPDTAAPPVDAGGEIATLPDAGAETQAENAPPTATISQPAAGAVVELGAPVTFIAQVGDDRDAPQDLLVSWSSTLNGTLGGSPASADGVATLVTTNLQAGAHTVSVQVKDAGGASTVATVTLAIEPPAAAPEPPLVTISPAAPTTVDVLHAEVATVPGLTYAYRWLRNGKDAGIPSSDVPAAATTKNEVWAVEVTAAGTTGTSAPGTAAVQVENSPPVCEDVALSLEAGVFSCECTKYIDEDGDAAALPVCQLSTGEVGCTQAATQPKGSFVTCTLSPSDGETSGGSATSAPVVVPNTPPAVGPVTLAPPAPGTCGPYTCTAEAADADGDVTTISWRWTVGGQPAGDDAPALGVAGLALGAHVQCFAKATDGADFGAEVASEDLVWAGLGGLPVAGPESGHEGIAGWNADGSGAEPAKTGHPLPPLPCISQAFAYYYIASRDYGAIDPSAKGAFHAAAAPQGLPAFAAALAAGGFQETDVTMRFGVTTLGDDQQGKDWSWEGTTETRTYTGGTFMLYLAGHPMITGPLPDVSVTIDYFDSCVLADDLVSVETAAGPVSDASAESPAAVQAAAKAFALDVAEVGVRFVFQARLPAVQVDFQGQGRWGAFFEVLSGTIEPGPCP